MMRRRSRRSKPNRSEHDAAVTGGRGRRPPGGPRGARGLRLDRVDRDRRELGRRGEEAVARRLAALGFTVVARNLRLQRGELDLVALRGGVLWFVECKCHGRSDIGPPLRAIDQRKRAALFRCAREFVVRRRHRGDWGFLAASVVWEKGAPAPEVALERLAIGPSAVDGNG